MNISKQNPKFKMTPVECACFAAANREKILAWLGAHGSREDAEEAFGELLCKVLGARIGSGSILKWDTDPFAVARTEDEWIGFLCWQVRARLKTVHSQRDYWHDPDPRNDQPLDNDLDALDETERILVSAVENGDRSAETVPAVAVSDDGAEESDSDGVSDFGRRPDADWRRERAAKHERVKGYVLHMENIRGNNYMPHPYDDLDAKIVGKAVWAAFADVCGDAKISRRDAQAYIRRYLFDEASESVCADLGITANNLFQIKFRIKKVLGGLGPMLFAKYCDTPYGSVA